MLRIEIDTSNAAFHDSETGEYQPGYEIARILRDLVGRIGHGHDDGIVWDVNGNRVGHFTLTADADAADGEEE